MTVIKGMDFEPHFSICKMGNGDNTTGLSGGIAFSKSQCIYCFITRVTIYPGLPGTVLVYASYPSMLFNEDLLLPSLFEIFIYTSIYIEELKQSCFYWTSFQQEENFPQQKCYFMWS